MQGWGSGVFPSCLLQFGSASLRSNADSPPPFPPEFDAVIGGARRGPMRVSLSTCSGPRPLFL